MTRTINSRNEAVVTLQENNHVVRIDIITGTYGKALGGGNGGFVASDTYYTVDFTLLGKPDGEE